MHDGTTPLILAARLAIEGMVEDLINADADINAADNSTKTALHWAAAVNNVDAVNILLSHGANRDAQDDKVIPAPRLSSRFLHDLLQFGRPFLELARSVCSLPVDLLLRFLIFVFYCRDGACVVLEHSFHQADIEIAH
jgi:hypothetical protein